MMDDETKSRIQKAIHDYEARRERKDKPTRKNKDPENQFIEEMLVPWLKRNGFSYNIVESKSTYNPQARRYISQSMAPGICDIIGNDAYGRSIFIEAKAPGKRATLRDNQRDFLIDKIRSNCFAVCVDSVDGLNFLYSEFMMIGRMEDRQKFLLDSLPKKRKKKDDGPLFE